MVLKTVGVTGASGMLGRHLVPALSAGGFRVVSYSRSGDDTAERRSWDLTQWKTETELDELFESVEAVVHAGAAVPSEARPSSDEELFDTNVRATHNLAHWARTRDVPLVYISSSTVYADPHAEDIPENAPLGWSGLGGFYGLTKLLAEDLLRREEDVGLRLAVLRPSSVYGVGLGAEKLVGSFLGRARQADAIELTEPVADGVNLIHAADFAAAVVEVLRRSEWRTFNLASDTSTSFSDLAATCIAVAGKGRILVRGTEHAARPPINRFHLKCDSARTLLEWSPRVGLSRGIRSLFEDRVILASQP